MGYWGYYAPYVSVAEKKAKAAGKLAKLKKKNPNIRPVVVEGRNIANTWWGKSWNQNLERYADYSNRIGRGRSYVKNGMVLDLQIEPGEITALVQGTSASPYSIRIKIKELPAEIWNSIKQTCQGKLDSMQELLAGKFPKDLAEKFMTKGQGLFPSPEQINFSCSCPDWASMCKHVAAALYGVGARLDEDPRLLFTLRKINVEELITEAVKDNTRQLLEKADKKSKRALENVNLSDMFGIELGGEAPKKPAKTKTAPAVQAEPEPAPAKKKRQPKSAAKAVTVQPPRNKPELSAMELVAELIFKSRKGVDIPALLEKTGLERSKVYNIVHRLKQQNRIFSPAWGIYQKAPGAKQ